jgi:hypothetical protein
MGSSERNVEARIALGRVVGSEGLGLRSSKSLTVSGRAVETLKHNLSRGSEEGRAESSFSEGKLLERFMVVAQQCQDISKDKKSLVDKLLNSKKASFLKEGIALVCSGGKHILFEEREGGGMVSSTFHRG